MCGHHIWESPNRTSVERREAVDMSAPSCSWVSVGSGRDDHATTPMVKGKSSLPFVPKDVNFVCIFAF